MQCTPTCQQVVLSAVNRTSCVTRMLMVHPWLEAVSHSKPDNGRRYGYWSYSMKSVHKTVSSSELLSISYLVKSQMPNTFRLWYNGVPALNFTNVEIRKSNTLASIGGLYFSTFFGGDDSTWATPTDQFSYYKNMQLFAGTGASTGKGRPSGSTRTRELIGGTWALGVATMLMMMGLGL
jgi:hypothetical protein